jgi:hypothetical protein
MGTKVSTDLRDEIAEARHQAAMAPIIINHYGGKSFAGHCPISEHDTAHARYLRAWRRSQQALGMGATTDDGYLP